MADKKEYEVLADRVAYRPDPEDPDAGTAVGLRGETIELDEKQAESLRQQGAIAAKGEDPNQEARDAVEEQEEPAGPRVPTAGDPASVGQAPVAAVQTETLDVQRVSGMTVAQVLGYLQENPTEVEAVKALERAGKGRQTILEYKG